MRGTIGPCSQGRSAWRQMWWCASTMPDQCRFPRRCGEAAAGLAARRRFRRPAAREHRSSAGKVAAVDRRVEDGQDRLPWRASAAGSADRRRAASTQISRWLSRARRLTAWTMASGSPRSSPSENTSVTAPRTSAAWRDTDRKASSEAPMRVPPSKSKTRSESRASASSGTRCFSVRGDARQPRAEAEGLDLGAGARQQLREAQRRLRMRLHRAGDVDQQQQPARLVAAAPCETAAASRRPCAAPRARCARRRCGGRAGRADACGFASSAAGRDRA